MGIFKWVEKNKEWKEICNSYNSCYDCNYGLISNEDVLKLVELESESIDVTFSINCTYEDSITSKRYDSTHTHYYLFYCIKLKADQYQVEKKLFFSRWSTYSSPGLLGSREAECFSELENEEIVNGIIRYLSPLIDYLKNNYMYKGVETLKNTVQKFVSKEFNYSDFPGYCHEQKLFTCSCTMKYMNKESIRMAEEKKEEEKRAREEKIERLWAMENEKRKRVFEPPFSWISFQFIVDGNWKTSLKILNSRGDDCSYDVFSPNIYLWESYERQDRYKKAVFTEGKKELVQLFSSLPAPESIERELLKKENIDHIIQCIMQKNDTEFTIHSIVENNSANEEKHEDDEDDEDEKETNINYVDQIDEQTVDYYLDQLNSLIGLESVKNDVIKMTKLIEMNKARKKEGKKEVPMTMHLVFTGNPGTGKTTVARLVAGIYHQLGVIKKGQLIEVDRSKLVARYIGQTAIKTLKQINLAMGGVLFIDEAYSLYSESDEDYGREAIDTILKSMEDKRDEFIVIMAGYTAEMKKLISMNPGLESRFNKYIEFPDYKPNELKQIFIKICNDNQFSINEDVENFVEEKLRVLYEQRDENFANARTIRNIFEKAVQNHAVNWSSSNNNRRDLNTLYVEDFIDVF